MQFLKKIKRALLSQKLIELPKKFATEEEYYTYFFTQHPKWNKPTPNKAEQERLNKIEELINNLNFNRTINIIDFGCGRGWLSYQLLKYGNVLGIEPVSGVVEYAKKIFPSVNFVVGSINVLENKKVDLIVSSEVIEHVDNSKKQDFFNSFYKALDSNGYCIVTSPRAEVQQHWLQYANNDGQPIEQWITENEMQQFATNAGFATLSKNILQQHVNGENTPLLDLYQIWLFEKNEN
jgi:cyclopropane fatty-acyl-phospholipid synthase-like methyltransferase